MAGFKRACMLAVGIAMLAAGVAEAADKESVLYRFTDTSGNRGQISGLVRDAKTGALFGTSVAGGSHGVGAVFRLDPPAKGKTAWVFSELRSLSSTSPGPYGGVLLAPSGALYGTDSQAGPEGNGYVFELTPPSSGKGAWAEKVIHGFAGGSGGYNPLAPLIRDSSGALYGTAVFGGPKAGLTGYFGIVFRLRPPAKGNAAWAFSELYAFGGGDDGGYPAGGLVRDASGALYGTTQQAGSGNGDGVVFKLTPPAGGGVPWRETVLHSFQGGSDGSEPVAGLAIDADGRLYGTTQYGGEGADFGNGTVFKLTPPAKGKTAWTYDVLHRFTGGADGAMPMAPVLVLDGAVYGTTLTGGTDVNAGNAAGDGVAFRLNPPAKGKTIWTETVLHEFLAGSDTTDGTTPTAGLVATANGTLFGTTSGGESGDLNGTIYALLP